MMWGPNLRGQFEYDAPTSYGAWGSAVIFFSEVWAKPMPPIVLMCFERYCKTSVMPDNFFVNSSCETLLLVFSR